MRLRGTHRLLCSCFNQQLWGRLDLAVLFTPSTPNRQNRNQVRWNICAGVRQSTPSFEVVQTEQSRDLFQKRWRIIACMRGIILFRLIYSGVLQSAQFYLFMWLFWRTPSTLKIAKSNPPLVNMHRCTDSQEHSLLADATRSQKYVLVDLGQTWFSCSLYSFHSEQAEQKTSALEHLCWRTPEYRLSRWCRQNSHVTCSETRWRNTVCMCGNICIAWFILEYSKVPSFTCFRWLVLRTPSTLKLLNQVHTCKCTLYLNLRLDSQRYTNLKDNYCCNSTQLFLLYVCPVNLLFIALSMHAYMCEFQHICLTC